VRVIRPNRDPLPRQPRPVIRERVTRTPKRIPDWLRDHIADKGEFVLLDCGHKDNINARATLIIAAVMGRGTQVFCERCGHFAGVVRHMRFREYADIPEKPNSDIPLF